MSKEVKEFLNGTATQQAATAMDTEPMADPALLKDIVKKQVDCQQKKMQAEINKLHQKINRSIKPVDKNDKKHLMGGQHQKTRCPINK